ncbi:hypothetical protein [Acinetobacter sp. AG3]|uniref:hypothetical protein n=1 Tax=unclassified Acinetobacter TaxID=196816 RepID=UPI001EF15D2F|nr:hypothetical protein [Acinetobacter sp. AG3]MCG7221212.1 hypothetical protein [Acinetobacter sp. AG3]
MGERTSKKTQSYEVDFGKTLLSVFSDYSLIIQQLVLDFVEYFEKKGLLGWKGKCTSSENVPYYFENKDEIKKCAQKYNLWHVHIGYPTWLKSPFKNILVSNFVLHFKKINECKIVLLSIGMHDPMKIPSEELCNEQ